MTDEKVGNLNEQALKRKERLMALKKQSAENKDKTADVKLPAPKFRSYKPQDENFQKNVLEDGKAGDVQTLVQDQLDLANATPIVDELDINSLQPRKPDWDLKRDVAKKLEKLERRTQKAIAELIRERLKQNQENLAAVVNVAVSHNSNTSEND